MKQIKDPFDLDWCDKSEILSKHGTLHSKKVIDTIVDKKYKASVSVLTPKCCNVKMKHIGDELKGESTGDCFRGGTSEYWNNHIYKCNKCGKKERRCYSHRSFESDNR